MLEGLDQVPWKDLKAGISRSESIPQAIRDLTSSDADVRDGAWHLLEILLNQKDVYFEASAYAIPFLIELVANDAISDRSKILGFLSNFLPHEPESYLLWQREATEAVVQGTQVYFDLLDDQTPTVRRSALDLLLVEVLVLKMPIEFIQKLERKLIQKIREENNAISRIGAIVALHGLAHRYPAKFQKYFDEYRQVLEHVQLTELNPMARAIAFLVMIGFLGSHNINEGILIEIASYIAYPEEKKVEEKHISPSSQDLGLGYLPINFEAQNLTFPHLTDKQITFVLMNALKSVESDFLARHIASSLLSLVFFGELEHLPSHNVQYEKDQLIYVYQQTQNKLKLNDLTELQKQVVWTIVNVDVLWVIPHNLLEYYGLPADRDEIRRLLESYHDDYS